MIVSNFYQCFIHRILKFCQAPGPVLGPSQHSYSNERTWIDTIIKQATTQPPPHHPTTKLFKEEFFLSDSSERESQLARASYNYLDIASFSSLTAQNFEGKKCLTSHVSCFVSHVSCPMSNARRRPRDCTIFRIFVWDTEIPLSLWSPFFI